MDFALGDACHSFVPFYGQGMNASFEDCLVLDKFLHRYQGLPHQALAQYQHARKHHTDAMSELSKQNFLEIRAKVRSPWFVWQKYLDLMLNRLFPKHWIPLYMLIMHTTVPYAEAVERSKKQELRKRQLIGGLLFGLVGSLFLLAIQRARH